MNNLLTSLLTESTRDLEDLSLPLRQQVYTVLDRTLVVSRDESVQKSVSDVLFGFVFRITEGLVDQSSFTTMETESKDF